MLGHEQERPELPGCDLDHSAGAEHQKGKKRATCFEGSRATGESRGISEGNWLLGLDSNQQPSG